MSEKDFSTFRENVRLLITSEGITQSQLAEKIGISESYMSRIMTGERPPSLDVVFSISKRYKRKMDDLINKSVLRT
jgi:transcriptional regulator with XRE-family HTH domain